MTADNELLQSLDKKLAIIRDRARGVALGYATGFYLWGEGGTSKTYTVQQTLDGLGRAYKVTNTRLTGRGLFDLLEQFPDVIHVLDDVETLFADKHSHGVLRAALWGQGQEPRTVVWQTGTSGRRETIFSGGVILIANCELSNVPALRAMRTRISTVRYSPTNEELAALMRSIAAKGFEFAGRRLPPEACMDVTEEILARSVRLNRNLDLRLLVNVLRDRVQYEDGQAEAHWSDLLESRMQERAVPPVLPLSAVADEVEVARAVAHLPREEKVRVWKERTGKSQATLYRRLSELSQGSQ